MTKEKKRKLTPQEHLEKFKEAGKKHRFKPGPAQSVIARKGGLANKNNPKLILSQRLRRMREQGMTNQNIEFLHDMMSNSELAAFQIMKYIQKLMSQSDGRTDMNQAAKVAIDWYKIKHGTKESEKTINLNVQLLSPEEKDKMIIDLLK